MVSGFIGGQRTAYCFINSYDKSCLSEDDEPCTGFVPDPFMSNKSDAEFGREPLQYFKDCLAIQIHQVGEEWERVIDNLERGIRQHV